MHVRHFVFRSRESRNSSCSVSGGASDVVFELSGHLERSSSIALAYRREGSRALHRDGAVVADLPDGLDRIPALLRHP